MTRTARYTLGVGLMLLLSATGGADETTGAAAGERVPEYHLKAAFLYNFAKFVRWPQKSFADEDAPFLLGVRSAHAMESSLRLIRGRKLDGRTIIVKTCHSPRDIRDCHMVYLNGVDTLEIKSFIRQGLGRPILTVGDTPDFNGIGGMIRFYVDEQKLRFEINPEAARQSGLKISAQLLEISRAHGREKREVKP